MTINIKNNVVIATKSHKDEWGEEIFGRITGCNGLVAEDAVYHLTCVAKFSRKTNSG